MISSASSLVVGRVGWRCRSHPGRGVRGCSVAIREGLPAWNGGAGRESRAGDVLVLFRTERWGTLTGGFLWWRRWASDREFHNLWSKRPAEALSTNHSTSPSWPPNWTIGSATSPTCGELLDMRWLSTEEAVAAAPSISGRSDPDGRRHRQVGASL